MEEGKEGLFLLDAGDLEKWDEKVLGPAVRVLDGEDFQSTDLLCRRSSKQRNADSFKLLCFLSY